LKLAGCDILSVRRKIGYGDPTCTGMLAVAFEPRSWKAPTRNRAEEARLLISVRQAERTRRAIE
jgi:hypothetical protein